MSDEPKGYAARILARYPQPASPAPEAAETPSDMAEAVPSNVTSIGPRAAALGDAHDSEGEAAAKVARRREAVRLNLKFADGGEMSLPYIHLLPVRWKGGEEMVLEYPWFNIRLKGRNLKRLKRRLDLHIQASIQEVDQVVDKAKNDLNGYAVYRITEEAKPVDE